MPKENTHLWFAQETLHHVPDPQLLRDVSGHMGRYYLGSFIPDTFFYASDRALSGISETLHGKDRALTNEAVLSVLDHARGMHDVAFALGYVTHCALDIVFHPVVNALAGDYYDEDPVRRSRSAYLHRRIETCIDMCIDNRLRIYRLTSPGIIRGLAYEDFIVSRFSVSRRALVITLFKQLLVNRLFASRTAYAAVRLLYGLGIVHQQEVLSLFYADVGRSDGCLQDPLSCYDGKTHSGKRMPLNTLFARAREMALAMMLTAYGYVRGSVSREQLLDAIPGASLSTGEVPAGETPSRPAQA